METITQNFTIALRLATIQEIIDLLLLLLWKIHKIFSEILMLSLNLSKL